MTEVPDAAVEAGRYAIEAAVLRSGGSVVLPFASEQELARTVIEAALPHLLAAGPDLTAKRWRQGGSHLNNVWAEAGTTGGKPGIPAGRMDSDELAARACADHNAMLDLRWLFSKGFGVRLSPYADFFPGAGGKVEGVMLYEVTLFDLEGDHLLTVDGQPSLGAALAEARKQAEEGATP